MNEHLVQFAVDAIMSYLQSYPDSADTIHGVHEWWIGWPGTPEHIAVTATALAKLEQAHLIERRRIGNTEIWRRPRPAQH
jgi:aryl-phospho-beta-D-glucosidase BglC (GH1 family)